MSITITAELVVLARREALEEAQKAIDTLKTPEHIADNTDLFCIWMEAVNICSGAIRKLRNT